MDEKKIRQEDCGEDSLGSGILTLTDRRITFEKTMSRMMDFSKRTGDTVIDFSLGDVKEVWKKGLLVRKLYFTVRDGDGEKTYKFGVMHAGGWAEDMQDAINSQS